MNASHLKRHAVGFLFVVALMQLTYGVTAHGWAEEHREASIRKGKLRHAIRRLFVTDKNNPTVANIEPLSEPLLLDGELSVFEQGPADGAPLPTAIVDWSLASESVPAAHSPDGLPTDPPQGLNPEPSPRHWRSFFSAGSTNEELTRPSMRERNSYAPVRDRTVSEQVQETSPRATQPPTPKISVRPASASRSVKRLAKPVAPEPKRQPDSSNQASRPVVLRWMEREGRTQPRTSRVARRETDSRPLPEVVPKTHSVMGSQLPSQHDVMRENVRPIGTNDRQSAAVPLISQLTRPRVIVRPAVPSRDATGRRILEPRVAMADGMISSVAEVAQDTQPLTEPPAEFIPIPTLSESVLGGPPIDMPIQESASYCGDCHPFTRGFNRFLALMKVEGCGDQGIGYERLDFAPFEILNSQPLNNIRFRFDAGSDWAFPDRAEYFWAGPNTRPAALEAGQVVDYQDLRFRWEIGGKRFSVATEIPIRIIDPDNNFNTPAANTAGMGDMSLTTKTVLLDGDVWQITQVMRTFFNTGSLSHGTGTGHVSLEPGLLGRIKWKPKTYLHGQMTYLFPLGADPIYAGQVLKYGMAVSHLWFDADNFAIIPTLEFVGWTVLDGSQTGLDGAPEPVDGIGIFNIHPGIRFVHDKGGDCGLLEFGISGGFAVSKDSWYEELLRLEWRWSY